MDKRIMYVIGGMYGTFFFDENDILVNYIHENDGDWRSEYMDCLLEHYGVIVEHIAPSSEHKRVMAQYEEEEDDDLDDDLAYTEEDDYDDTEESEDMYIEDFEEDDEDFEEENDD